MNRNIAYKIAKYTSWIIILFGIVLPLILTLLLEGSIDLEGLIFGYIFIIPFLIVPFVLFLVVLWITGKWKKTFKSLLVLFVIALASFMLWGLYLYLFENLVPQFAFIAGILYIILLIESIILLSSKN